jgi:hypothetical protein
MVENATEEDWRDVRLSLVSGRPISFVMDLYTPIYVPRPVEELELYASLRPPEHAGVVERLAAKGIADKDAETLLEARRRGGAAGRRGVPARPPAGGRAGKYVAGFRGRQAGEEVEEVRRFAGIELGEAGVASVATAQEAGELFEYTIRTPVSIPRQHSAMLPIVNEQIAGEKVSVYNQAVHAKYPLNALHVENTTDLHLMQGPITLFDGDVYAGDAKLPDLKPGEKRLVSYALDLGTEVMVKQQPHPDEIVSLRIAKGTLIHKHRYLDEREYVVRNKTDKARTVLIEQAYGDEWKLLEPDKPHERAPGLSRFKVVVPAQESGKQTVKLEQVTDQTVALRNLGTEEIRFYLRSRVISAEVKQVLERVIAMQTELGRVQRELQQRERDVNEQVNEQERVRKNLNTLRENTDAYRRQLEKFDQIETRIERLREQIAQLRQQEEQKRQALETYLLSLNVE